MTIAVSSNKVTYVGNGSTTAFPYTFEVLLQSHLSVLITDSSGNITTLNSGQYSVTGIGGSNGGTVTYPLSGSPLPSGSSITILRTVPAVQQTSLVNQSGYYPSVVEAAFDYLTMLAQQIIEQNGRILTLPAVDVNPITTLPPAAQRANNLLSFDANGNPTVGAPTSAIVSVAMQPIISAATISAAIQLLGLLFTQTGTGAVTKSLQSKARERVSWFDFMTPSEEADVLAGTLSIDVTAAVQLALDACYGNGTNVRTLHCIGKAKITSKLIINCGLQGDGPFENGNGAVFVWYGAGSTVLESASPPSGLTFKNFAVDMRNVTTDTLAFHFTRGLVGSYWECVRFIAWNDGNPNFFTCTFKNHDSILIDGDNGAGGKADISLNTYKKVFMERCRRGITTTDPYNQAAGGESSFEDCFGLCKEWVFRTTGHGNRWSGGDFAARATFSIWKFSGNWAGGNVIEGVSADTQTSGDYAIISDADTSGMGAMGVVIGGKISVGSWWNDLGLGTKLQRWMRLGDEDGLSSLDGKSAFLRGRSAMTTDVTVMGGVIGQGGKFITVRGDSGAVSGMLALGNSTGAGTDPGGASGASIIIDDSDNSNVRFLKTSNGTTLTEFFRFKRQGHFSNTAAAPSCMIDMIDSAASDASQIAGIGGSVTAAIKIYATQTAGSATYNVANAAMKVAQNVGTSRSINAAGTVNASGADYAEYERKRSDCGLIDKGQIVGFDAAGLLTDKWSLSLRFLPKSTNPAIVGGDAWGTEDIIGIEPNQRGKDHDAWIARLEVERAKVDRIAYSGKAPCNVLGANPGDYIIAAKGPNDTIIGLAIANPTFDQYRLVVGRVNRILPDGRAEVAIIVH